MINNKMKSEDKHNGCKGKNDTSSCSSSNSNVLSRGARDNYSAPTMMNQLNKSKVLAKMDSATYRLDAPAAKNGKKKLVHHPKPVDLNDSILSLIWAVERNFASDYY